MGYAIAAYSITLGALLVYGVWVQHRIRMARARQGGVSPAELGRGFNLGAALLAPLWALAHGQYALGATLGAGAIAFGAVSSAGLRLPALALGSLLLGGAVFFGVVGNRIAAARALAAAGVAERASAEAGVPGAEAEAVARTQLAWSLAGALLYTVVLPWAYHALRASSAG